MGAKLFLKLVISFSTSLFESSHTTITDTTTNSASLSLGHSSIHDDQDKADATINTAAQVFGKLVLSPTEAPVSQQSHPNPRYQMWKNPLPKSLFLPMKKPQICWPGNPHPRR